jgi:hypothetical protein
MPIWHAFLPLHNARIPPMKMRTFHEDNCVFLNYETLLNLLINNKKQ